MPVLTWWTRSTERFSACRHQAEGLPPVPAAASSHAQFSLTCWPSFRERRANEHDHPAFCSETWTGPTRHCPQRPFPFVSRSLFGPFKSNVLSWGRNGGLGRSPLPTPSRRPSGIFHERVLFILSFFPIRSFNEYLPSTQFTRLPSGTWRWTQCPEEPRPCRHQGTCAHLSWVTAKPHAVARTGFSVNPVHP